MYRSQTEANIQKFIELGMEEGVNVRAVLNSLNIKDKREITFPSKWLPKRSQIPTEEDTILREALGKIREDIYYSKRNRKIYTLNELLETFAVEGKVIENLNFRESSSSMKIFNVNVYILNEKIDGLFFFVEARKYIGNIDNLEFNVDRDHALSSLFGISPREKTFMYNYVGQCRHQNDKWMEDTSGTCMAKFITKLNELRYEIVNIPVHPMAITEEGWYAISAEVKMKKTDFDYTSIEITKLDQVNDHPGSFVVIIHNSIQENRVTFNRIQGKLYLIARI